MPHAWIDWHHRCAPSLEAESRPCGRAPTLARLVEAVAHSARAKFGAAAAWSLFVAADAPATREFIVAHARRMGINAVHSAGTVGHNNLWCDLL